MEQPSYAWEIDTQLSDCEHAVTDGQSVPKGMLPVAAPGLSCLAPLDVTTHV